MRMRPGRSLLLLAVALSACAAPKPRVSSYGPPPPVREPTPSVNEEYDLIVADALTAKEQEDLASLRTVRYEPPPNARPPQLNAGLSELLAEEGSVLINEKVGYDIPIVLNDRVEWWIDYFSNRIHDSFERYLIRSGAWLPYLQDELRKAGLPEDLAYLALIESGFSTAAVSRAGAVGPWQFMSFTGRDYGLRIDRWVDERRDYERATQAAIAYLSDLHAMLGSWYLAAAAYNGGQGRVSRSMLRDNTTNFWELTDLHEETKNYVPKLIAATIIAKEPGKYGFSDVPYLEPIDWETVTVPTSTDLDVIARAAETSPDIIHMLNPQLIRGRTPPGEPNFQIKIPAGRVDDFHENFTRLAPSERLPQPTVHVVRRGETIRGIAESYGVDPQELMQENHIRHPRSLKVGQRLRIPGVSEGQAEDRAPDEAAPEQVAPGEAEPDSVRQAAPILTRRSEVERKSSATVSQGRSERVHVVQPGETLSSIAARYDARILDIRRANGLVSNAIRPGQRLKIP